MSYDKNTLGPKFRPGPRPSPRRALNPAFHSAVLSDSRTLFDLASLAGFAAGGQLCYILRVSLVAASPLTVSRLQALAQIVGYSGPLFADEDAR